ncbi:MAG: oxidoreductase [Alphaproteobacteria bacterium]|nr:oxidoreductase [Alphaproteobacteria bacterium]
MTTQSAPVKALLQTEEGKGDFADITLPTLTEGDIKVAVAYSTINYKDGMVLKGVGRLVRNFPHVPGVDFAGTVIESEDPAKPVGAKVVVTGWRVGEAYWGGYSEQQVLKGKFATILPDNITPKQAMGVGTAGFTAMLAIDHLERAGLNANDNPKPILVTGASGGVGTCSLVLLSALGYQPVAVTGRPEQADWLKALGAHDVAPRDDLTGKGKPLERETWGGAIDSVGGGMLGRLLAQMASGASVAAVGLAGGSELTGTVLPFLLRGVNLLGVDSVMCPQSTRDRLWPRIGTHLVGAKLETITTEHDFAALPALADDILAGKIRGRAIIRINP